MPWITTAHTISDEYRYSVVDSPTYIRIVIIAEDGACLRVRIHEEDVMMRKGKHFMFIINPVPATLKGRKVSCYPWTGRICESPKNYKPTQFRRYAGWPEKIVLSCHQTQYPMEL
jgi:hypothetical protein